jgi:hypothetical protein
VLLRHESMNDDISEGEDIVIQKDAVSDRKSGGETAGAGDEQSDGDFVPSSEVGKGAVGGNVIWDSAAHAEAQHDFGLSSLCIALPFATMMQSDLESLRLISSTLSSSALIFRSIAVVRALFRPRFVATFSSACLAISNTPCVLNTYLPCNATILPFLRLLQLPRNSLTSASSRRSTTFPPCRLKSADHTSSEPLS